MFGILRTLLAINVVLLHIFNVPTLGNYSVSFFFLLSGFLMTLIMHESYGYTKNGFRTFWLNRGLRLYPSYWFILVITIIMIITFPSVTSRHSAIFMPDSIANWLSNLSMIYPEVLPHRYNPRVVPTSWALTNELCFYLLISLGISKTFKRTIVWVILSILYYILTYLYYDIPTYRYGAIFASSLPFALGAMLYWINKKIELKNVSLSLIIILYICFWINAFVTTRFSAYLSDFPIYLNMVIAFFLIFLLYNFKTNKYWRRKDYHIGMFSYPLYLSHYLVAIFYVLLINNGMIGSKLKMEIPALPYYGLLLFLFCFLIVYCIDIPIDKLKLKLKKKIK